MSVPLRRRLLPATAVLAAAGGLAACGGGSGTGTAPAGAAAARPATAAASGSTPPPALRRLPDRRATVWAVGDGADGGGAARTLAHLITRARPDLFLYLGDVYETGSPQEFAAHYDAVYGALAARTAPTPGNHDWAANAVGYAPYWRRALGGPVPRWYAVRTAGWTLLSLNSEAPHDPGSAQVAWARRLLAGPGDCRIAFWHRPRFSAGLHGDAADVAPLWDTVRGRAALVLNGHDHTSQRLTPVGGTTEYVAGAGGHAPYPLNTADRRLAYGSTGAPTALRLRLRPGRADLAFVRDDGRTVDRDVVRCHPGG